MIKYHVSDLKRKAIWPIIDDIYHSTTWQDMWMKIDLNGFKVDLDAFMLLCNTFCYHYGFWVHTKPRFFAFKKFLKLKRENPLTKVKLQKKTLEAVRREAEWHDIGMFLNPVARTKGRRDVLRAWKSIQHILEKCQTEKVIEKKDKRKKLRNGCSGLF